MEIADNIYTIKHGGNNVLHSDILHIHEGHPKATIIADLTDAPQIKDNTYDCIILTQTLQYIYEYKKAVETCYRILKPGGVLLVTVPGISQIEKGEWYKYWCFTFSENCITKNFVRIFPIR